LRGRHLVYTLLLTLSIGLHALGMHMLATVLPSIVADLGGAAFYAWATLLYTIASIIGTVCGGRLTARLDLRRGYLVGALVFLAGSVGCATAPHIAVLLLARTLQGFGSGLLVSIAYSMVSELYVDVLRPRVLSAISGMWGVAALLGPLVGGMFAASEWWRGAFWVTMPVLVPLCLLAWYTLPAMAINGGAGSFPLLRLTLLGIGVLGVATSGQVPSLLLRLALIGSAIVLVGWAFRCDNRAANRLFPSQPLSLKTSVGIASWIFLLFGITTSQATVFMPLIVHVLYGVSLLEAGYITALLSLAWTIMALYSASLQDRRVRVVIVSGPLMILGGITGLAASIAHGPLLLLSLCVSLIGAGIGVCFAHISSWSIAVARQGERAVTASAIPTLQSLGIAFGAALAGLVANTAGLATDITPSTIVAAATWVYRLAIIAPFVLTILAWRLVQLHKQRPRHFPATLPGPSPQGTPEAQPVQLRPGTLLPTDDSASKS
jgi:MFS family permease